ncbi:MAG: threonine/serine exporter family protein [Deltaproteobacteria bacterium]|nr:threonine/serine exporter family protein [Deltaproteobacteria bacterium]
MTVAPDISTRVLLALAQALHEHGTPAHRLEDSLARVARALELHTAQFLSTPTAMHLAFGDGAGQRVYLCRATSERVDLATLGQLDEIVDDIVAGRLAATGALARLEALRTLGNRHSPRAKRWASATASGTAAVFLGGGLAELVLASALGWVVGALAQWSARMPRARPMHAPLAAFCVAVLVSLASAAAPGLSDGLVLVSALIMLVPGLTLTVAMTELASGHVVSGTARLAGGMTLMFTILFGAALGRPLAAALPVPVGWPLPALELPPGTWLACLAATTIAFTILLEARSRDAGWIAVACGVGYGAARLGAWGLGPELGAFAGAVAVGLASNAVARRFRRPATLMRLPGLLLLVPGSLGFRSLDSLLMADTIAGTDGLFRVGLVTVALATGLFAADLLLPTRRAL